MDKLNKLKQLCDEASILIGEFSKEAGYINESQVKKISTTYASGTIIITNKNEETIEYTLSEISYLFQDKIIDFWPLGNRFFFDMECYKTSALKHYDDLDKMEFIEYIGNLHYTELRCNQIVARLKKIEAETFNL